MRVFGDFGVIGVLGLYGKTRQNPQGLGRKSTLQPGLTTDHIGYPSTVYGSTAFTSLMTATPDIPLREPLEFEYRVNRKIAKKIYHDEKL